MRTTSVRVTTFVGGVLLSAYTYLLVTVTTLGSSPLFVLEEGIAQMTELPFGIVTAAMGMLLLGVASILRAPVGPGTFAVPMLFGLSVELLSPLVPAMDGTSINLLIVRAIVLLVATNLMMLGGALIVSASYGASAVDAVMLGLASVLHRDSARVRIVMDFFAAVAGVALGGVAGLGTIVGVLIMGHSFRFWAGKVGNPSTPHREVHQSRLRRRSASRSFRPSLSMQSTGLASPQPEPTAPCARAVTRSPDAHEEVDPLVVATPGIADGRLQRQRRRFRLRG